MKIKVSEATLPQLNWMVAKCQGHPGAKGTRCGFGDGYGSGRVFGAPNYSGDWSLGGPIIAQHIVLLEDLGDFEWEATAVGGAKARGDTVLQAVCRCYVTNEAGYEVDVPEELL